MPDSTTPPLPGPDLMANGLLLTDLPDGGMTSGHAQGEPVLLARRGTKRFAISAKWSHLGAPLGQGLLDGETVRCPWHHACFSLRPGPQPAALLAGGAAQRRDLRGHEANPQLAGAR